MCSDHAALTFHCCALAHASANAFNSENRSSGCVEGSSPSHPLSPFTAALARSRFLDRNAVHRAAYTSHLLTACVWLAAHWDASHSDTRLLPLAVRAKPSQSPNLSDAVDTKVPIPALNGAHASASTRAQHWARLRSSAPTSNSIE